MTAADEYRQHAQVCLSIAQTTFEPRTKASMNAMAAAWLRLAVQAEKNGTLDLVYETPRAFEPQPVQMQQQQAKGE
jgi:hypothetical protein